MRAITSVASLVMLLAAGASATAFASHDRHANLHDRAVGNPSAAVTARILVIVPSEGFLRLTGGRMVRVGTYLDEAIIPALKLVELGAELVFASPSGNKPPIDPHSNSSSYFGGNETAYRTALKFWDTYPSLQTPRKISDFAPENPDAPWDRVAPELAAFDGVFVPGGHAPIIDLWPSTAVGRILTYFLQAGRRPAVGGPTLVAAICHGPITLAAAAQLHGLPWPFAGRNMTIFSTAEEKLSQASKWDNVSIGFYPQAVLTELGGNVAVAAPWTSHVVQDGNLITGQNPQSAEELANGIVSWLGLA